MFSLDDGSHQETVAYTAYTGSLKLSIPNLSLSQFTVR